MDVDDLLDDSKVEVQDFAGGWSIPRYLGGPHPVWGLTAYITQYFLAQASLISLLAPRPRSPAHTRPLQVLLPAACPTDAQETASKL